MTSWFERLHDGILQLGYVEAPNLDSVVHTRGEHVVSQQRDVSMQHLGTMTLHAAKDGDNCAGGDVPQADGVV